MDLQSLIVAAVVIAAIGFMGGVAFEFHTARHSVRKARIARDDALKDRASMQASLLMRSERVRQLEAELARVKAKLVGQEKGYGSGGYVGPIPVRRVQPEPPQQIVHSTPRRTLEQHRAQDDSGMYLGLAVGMIAGTAMGEPTPVRADPPACDPPASAPDSGSSFSGE